MNSDMMSSVYGLTMQWTPEQPQWAEQHYDITSTTRSPAHKFEAFHGQRLTSSSSARVYQHSWANDDISALTASNLLKRYAERYSTILDLPCESGLMGYPEPALSAAITGPNVVNGAPSLINGRKLEVEPWLEGVYQPLGCISELVPKAPLSVPDMSASVSSSPVEPSFSSSSCSSQTTAQDYSNALYTTPYLQSVGSYNGPLLHPVASHPNLVPSYSANTSPSLPTYAYPSGGYPSQSSLSQGYSPPSPSTACLSTSITPATPLQTSSMSGYSYPTSNLAPVAPSVPDNSPRSSSLSKAYYSAGQGDMRAFEEYGFGGSSNSDSQSASSPLYRPPGGDEGHKGNGFEQSANVASLPFKPANPSNSLRSLESLAATMGEHGTATAAHCFAATSCSAASSNVYSPASARTHLCLDTHTPC